MRENCWNALDCGMQPGGEKAKAVGYTCPACTSKPLHGANGGVNGGRACWVVAGTLCNGELGGSFVEKLSICRGCAFHAQVRREQGDDYVNTKDLLQRLREV